MLANAIHIFTYHVSVQNQWPIIITAILAIGGFLWIMIFAEESDGFVMFGLFLWLLILIPVFTMDWHHTEARKGIEMQVHINNQDVWIPAKRLPNGDYWPITFTRSHQ